jgi:hypothetical protein
MDDFTEEELELLLRRKPRRKKCLPHKHSTAVEKTGVAPLPRSALRPVEKSASVSATSMKHSRRVVEVQA